MSAAYALVTVSTLEDRVCHLTGTRPSISLQYLMLCNAENYNGNTTGNVYDSVRFIMKNGMLKEECYPLMQSDAQDTNNRCEPKCNNRHSDISIQGICSLSGEESMKREIIKNGPVVAEINIKSDFLTYRTGIYTYKPSAGVYQISGSHVIKIVGWGTSNNVKYWIIENTWGEDWGENGYAKVEINSIRGIIREQSAIAIQIKKS